MSDCLQNILIIFLLPFLFYPTISVSAAPQTLKTAIELIESEDYRKAYKILKKLKGKDDAIEKRVDYLIGHTTLRLEMFDKCAEYFNKGVTGYPELADYAYYNISRCYATSGRFREATAYLEKFKKKYPDSRLIERATFHLGKHYISVGESEKGLAILKDFIKRYPGSEYIAAAYYARGEELEGLGHFVDAYEMYRIIFYKYPTSPFSGQALSKTISIAKNKRLKIRSTPIKMRQERVELLFKSKRYKAAISDINERVMPALKGKDKEKVFLLLAKCHAMSGQRGEGVELLRRYIEKYPNAKGVAEAYYTVGRLYWNMGRREDALNYMRITAKKFRGTGQADSAIYVIGRIYARQGKTDKAVETYRKLIAVKHNTKLTESAYWRIGWIFYTDKKYGEVVSFFQEALKKFPDSNLRNAYLYWMGRSYENLGDRDSAISSYSAVLNYPYFYYFSLAINRLNLLGVRSQELKVTACADSSDNLYKSVLAIPGERKKDERLHLTKALELSELGFEEDARLELDMSQPLFEEDTKKMWLLSRLYESVGLYNVAIHMRNKLLFSMEQVGRESMPKDKQRLLYPLSYWKEIIKYSKNNKIDPFIAIAIMRQESRFDQDALSSANARGLMQLINSTGERMYRKVYGRGFNGELLFDPEINISLGTRYFSQLINEFDGNNVAAIASYNAGPIPVKKWIVEFKGLPDDEFIENVPYPQTKGYLKKVLGNYYNYKRLYPKGSGCAKNHI